MELEIYVGQFGGVEPLLSIEPTLWKHGIKGGIISGALNADEADMDDLSMHLMECLVTRAKIPKAGPGHINARRSAISDSFINYLIAMMLEAIEWKRADRVVIPSSLIVLIRDRLCGPMPDLHRSYMADIKRNRATFIAAKLSLSNKLTVRSLARLAGVKKTTASGWLSNPEFKKQMEYDKARLCR